MALYFFVVGHFIRDSLFSWASGTSGATATFFPSRRDCRDCCAIVVLADLQPVVEAAGHTRIRDGFHTVGKFPPAKSAESG